MLFLSTPVLMHGGLLCCQKEKDTQKEIKLDLIPTLNVLALNLKIDKK